MAYIQVAVQRPVAFPDKFLGAPMLPSFTAFVICGLGMMICFIFKNIALWGMLFMVVWPFLHGFLMMIGFREPHLTTLMMTWHLTKIAPRTLGSRAREVRIFHAS